MKPKLTFTAEDGLMEILIDGHKATEWGYEDDPKDLFEEFETMYWSAYHRGRIDELEAMEL